MTSTVAASCGSVVAASCGSVVAASTVACFEYIVYCTIWDHSLVVPRNSILFFCR